MKRGCSGPNARRLGDVAKARHWGHRQARRGVDSAVRGGMVDVRWRTRVFVPMREGDEALRSLLGGVRPVH
jgi:hypothetical protein